jgi:serine/threonine protein kinase
LKIDQVGLYRVLGSYPHAGFRGIDITSGIHVHLELWPDVEWRERASQHLRASAILDSLAHPGIAPLRGRGILSDRRPWLAFDLPEGVTLYDLLRSRALTPELALSLVHDLAEIVAHVHARGFAHNAIEPHLVVLGASQRGRIRLLGWGDIAPATSGAADLHAIATMIFLGLRSQIISTPTSDLLIRMLGNRITAAEVVTASARLLERARIAKEVTHQPVA